MSDHLITIHCDMSPIDTLVVEQAGQRIVMEIQMCEDDPNEHAIALNRQSAQELYDLLGEFLADDQR